MYEAAILSIIFFRLALDKSYSSKTRSAEADEKRSSQKHIFIFTCFSNSFTNSKTSFVVFPYVPSKLLGIPIKIALISYSSNIFNNS